MGAASPWHEGVIKLFNEKIEAPGSMWCRPYIHFFNPRRDDWDASWKQEIGNQQFKDQVFWELQRIDEADHVFFNFEENTKSPITLLELGYAIGLGKGLVIRVAPEFWRKGNIDIIAILNGYNTHSDMDSAVQELVADVLSK